MTGKLISIGKASKILGVTQTTLRRWDASGKLVAIRAGKGSRRLYRIEDIEKFIADITSDAKEWASTTDPFQPKSDYYCPNSAVFQTRLQRMEADMIKREDLKEIFSLISSVAGEIGNNSFDHNLGKWSDIAGIFFTYDLNKRVVVLADRGQGILQTLKRVKKELQNHEQALRVAFTEIITGRAPEHRGNGLKYVRRIVTNYPISLVFQTGDATTHLEKGDLDIDIEKAEHPLQGCLAIIRF